MNETAEMPPARAGELRTPKFPAARVANLNLILGATELFGYSLLLLLLTIALDGFRGAHAGPAEQGPARQLILSFFGILALSGLLKILAGWSLRAQRPWGRTLTLMLGALAGLLALSLVVIFQVREHLLGQLFQGRFQAGIPFLVPLAYGAYAGIVFASLRSRKSASEFS